jgi:hypothetical protein
MRKAIETKFFASGAVTGSRYRAKAEGNAPVWMPQDYSVNFDWNHCACAKMLAEKLAWHGLYVAGGNAKGDGFVYVCVGLHAQRDNAVTARGQLGFGIEGVDWFYVEPREGR